MDAILKFFEEPIVSFSILLAVILTVPPLVERMKLPGLVGLLVAGVILGPNGLHLLTKESETMQLLSEIGLLYLMFVAGLEVDMAQFRKIKYQSMGFGSLTFLVPLITGTAIGHIFGFGWNASILLGSILASHTLLAYPIVSRLGVVSNRAVMVTIGATIFTDVGALLVLAICIGIHGGNFTLLDLGRLLGLLAAYTVAVLFGFDWAGREFFRRTGNDEGNQFLFVLLAIFLASLGAQIIGVEKIVGAFLAGLAVNDAVGDSPVKEKVVFVGTVLFIPFFFINIGLLIDLGAFGRSIQSIWLMLAIVAGLITSKFIAAWLTQLIYRYNRNEMLVMWSLSLPQVGATLAATLVGYRAGLLNEGILNSVIAMMLVTSTLGPLITSRTAPGLVASEAQLEPEATALEWGDRGNRPFKVIVPVYNPETEQFLIEMAALLARHSSGQVLPLAIAPAHATMDAPALEAAVERSELLLERAKILSGTFDVSVTPILRIDDEVASGISRASREQDASLIVMGWGNRSGLRAKLFGNLIDSVLWSAHCPVAVTRLLAAPSQIRRILVPIENLTTSSLRPLSFAQALAQANQAEVTLLHVCDRRTSDSQQAWMRSQLTLLSQRWMAETPVEIRVTPQNYVPGAIVSAAKAFDLVVLRASRQRTPAGGLAISDLTTTVAQQIACSVVLLGEPNSPPPRLMGARSPQQTISVLQ